MRLSCEQTHTHATHHTHTHRTRHTPHHAHNRHTQSDRQRQDTNTPLFSQRNSESSKISPLWSTDHGLRQRHDVIRSFESGGLSRVTCRAVVFTAGVRLADWSVERSSGNIVDRFRLYLVSLSTNTHSVRSLITLKHYRKNRHLPDYIMSLCALSRA